jgi:hypothetical protein
MGLELEDEESIRLERELIAREAYISEELLPAAYEMYEMMEFFESAVPTMFVNVRGKNFLLKREMLLANTPEMAY